MLKHLSIIVVEQDTQRAHSIVDALRDIGLENIKVIQDPTGLARQVKAYNPDVVLIDVSNPSRDSLEELTIASDPMSRPVAMFVDTDTDGLAKAAIEAGVSAYVVDGLSAGRLRPVLDAAIARFNMFGRLRNELEQSKRALEDRKVIDRAKGLLMKARGVDEDAAYGLLRRAAMDQGRKVADVAHSLVTAADLLS
ncbi:response regulator receiver and ANTAR domain protein [Pacificibacter maritimus]|uniref:Response regulator receiver and ANTAR domain protein n=1 Tax=Pacificibacter maritimus TaxID=762213 RepID=A0A3N4V0T3_9RHOB|nr:ANTAR domain-containing protein [Pacificibacter maritimus]RPE66514.1 response regulator receiver and ANTAR domain protein [Pacificibacter maritimus]